MEAIDISEYQPRRIPSAKWRELITSSGSRLETADCRETIARIHQGGRITSSLQPTVCSLLPGPDPPGELIIEPCFDLSAVVEAEADDVFPDYDTDPDLIYAND